MSWSTPTNYLKNVATWFSDLFDMFFWFLNQFGWYWIVIATICGYMIFRLIVLPIVGGRTLTMGMDKAKKAEKVEKVEVDRRIDSVTYTKNADGTRTGVYRYRNDK